MSQYIRHTPKLHEHHFENGGIWVFWCPACDDAHMYQTGEKFPPGVQWEFNGNIASPSFTPSLLMSGVRPRCHLFVTNGMICYCGDCGHSVAGKTIPMVDLPPHWQEGNE